ncbi:response regulator [Paenibacillus sp. N3.4]|uniref:response regulator n=1 Tax=Paenibacillus sp. N3.4 TaxID=2603222 RepID=UPI0011CA6FA5|nr:response regulator [Paenibacillus sp. N3.4]TXK83710.1 response regulator [Paenibacillus sp. N3.4]
MFNVVIVEDEKPILELMKVLIGRNPHYTITGAFSNPLEALDRLPSLRPDVVFLDVEMPKINGLELAHRLNEISDQTRIVFTTAYKEYALDAFQVYAFDYILKPVTPTAIERVTNRLIKQNRTSVQPGEQARVMHASNRCFGGFEVRNPQGTLVRWPTRKTEELYAFFLCHPGQDISKWHLADILWPDMLEERASHNLHNTIYRLKKILKEQELGMDIQKTNEGYMLDTLHATYDLLEFQNSGLAPTEGVQDEAQAERLCTLYQGPLLDRKDYLWKVQLEVGYGKQYTGLVRSLIGKDMKRQDWGRAEQRLDTYLSLYPLNEDMQQLLMDVYVISGKREQIAKHYVSFEAHYRRELGIEPPKEMRKKIENYLK